MGNKGLILFIILAITSCCRGQQLVMPNTMNPTTPNQLYIWDGTTLKLKELVGFTVSSTQLTIPSAVDGSVTNEGQLTLSGNTSVSGATLTSNTSGSTAVKIAGADGIYIHKSTTNDTLIIGNNDGRVFTNHAAVTVTNSTTQTNVGGALVEVEDAQSVEFTIYLRYTTGATSQGLQFRLNPSNSSIGTFWYDYDFPITGSRTTGMIYNANTTITIPSSESGTNMAVIRGVSKSSAVGAGLFGLQLQISAEDGSSTITTSATGITQF